jgi:NAD(P)-dependent dehydrogenase (short-subunit alcohol dehydrogenase family)
VTRRRAEHATGRKHTAVSGINEGRVAIVTGAGRGIGRSHALELARQGAKVVVNDVGGDVDGRGSSQGPGAEVVEAIRAGGGQAVANGDDVSDWDGAHRLVQTAIEEFGSLDVVVNNAGILRDRMLANMSIDEWDAVIRVHLRGTFATMRRAAEYWRLRSKAGHRIDARIINTTSASGLFGNPGQVNYGAAKAGIAALTTIAAAELAQYGVTVNAINPGARTRMTEQATPGGYRPVDPGTFDVSDPGNIAPLVAWLSSPESAGVTGRVFTVRGGAIRVLEGWHAGPSVDAGRRWDAAELGPVVAGLVARATPNADLWGEVPGASDPESAPVPGA